MYNIFISHSWDQLDDLNGLRRLLNNRGYFNVSFEEFTPENPINSSNVEYMKRRIRERISNSHVVIGMAGVYASHSEWMQWELESARAMGKPILGVVPWGQLNVSQVVRNNATELVRWNTESIVEAIRRLA